MGKYEAFPGLCFVDTLELTQNRKPAFDFMNPENTERVQRQVDAPITVIIGNPPYNVGQKNENDNNKNRVYRRKSKSEPEGVDDRVSATYGRDSRAANKNALSDMFVKFFRWASDRLGQRDGVVCFVTNNAFFDNISYDGMRKHLLQDFDTIYHLDCRGNVRQNPRLSGTAYNVFGIQVGVGITVAVRKKNQKAKELLFHQFELDLRRKAKLKELGKLGSIVNVNWRSLASDSKNNWLIRAGAEVFSGYIPLGGQEAKSGDGQGEGVLFKTYGRGIATSRDEVVYSFDRGKLITNIKKFANEYNYEIHRFKKVIDKTNIDDYVNYSVVQWSRDLKQDLIRGNELEYANHKIRRSVYRPFTNKHLFFDKIGNEEVYVFPKFYPLAENDLQNRAVCLTGIGSEKPFLAIATGYITDLHVAGAGASAQCFPFYTYAEDGTNRRENITDWALKHFQDHYGRCALPDEAGPMTPEEVAGIDASRAVAKPRNEEGGLRPREIVKWDIFHYVYAVLHHPVYRERYAEVLKKELPRVPLLAEFRRFVTIGRALAGLHVHYEHVKPYPGLKYQWQANLPVNWRVEKMKLSKDKTALQVNDALTLAGIPLEVGRYRLGNRSALEWVVDQYRVDPKTGEDPNRPDDEEYIVRLVGQVVAVSLETVALVESLPPWPDPALEEALTAPNP